MDDDRLTIDAAGYPFSALAWGDPAARPLLLVHGVTASAEVWWRVGPCLAATDRRVIALDLPGHGRTGHWRGRHRFDEIAEDVAAFIRTATLDRPDLQIVGHSLGAMVTAALPGAGLPPATIVLLDPPAIPVSLIGQMANDPRWRKWPTVEEATQSTAAANPGWPDGDVAAAGQAMQQVDVEGARSIVLANGDWDAGLAALEDPAAAGIPVWLIRGDPASGGLTMDAAAQTFVARYGADHVITIPGAPHGPQRTHFDETLAAIQVALTGG